MKTYLALVLLLGVNLPFARAESGPPRLDALSKAMPPLPGAADPSEMLEDDEGLPPPKSIAPKPAPVAAQPEPPNEGKAEPNSNALEPIARRTLPGLTLPGSAVLQPKEATAAQAPVLSPAAAPAAASMPALQPLAAPPSAKTQPKVSTPTITVSDSVPAPVAAPSPQRTPSNDTKEKFVETKVSLEDPTNVHGPEFAILLTDGKFRPARVRLKAGETSRILFTTLGPKPAALIIERLRVQKWLTRPEEANKRSPASVNAPWEVNRELSANRLTEIAIEPVKGNYMFHDAISGAAGEIIVE